MKEAVTACVRSGGFLCVCSACFFDCNFGSGIAFVTGRPLSLLRSHSGSSKISARIPTPFSLHKRFSAGGHHETVCSIHSRRGNAFCIFPVCRNSCSARRNGRSGHGSGTDHQERHVGLCAGESGHGHVCRQGKQGRCRIPDFDNRCGDRRPICLY